MQEICESVCGKKETFINFSRTEITTNKPIYTKYTNVRLKQLLF